MVWSILCQQGQMRQQLGSSPCLQDPVYHRHWVYTQGKLYPIYKGVFTLVNYRGFLLFTAGNSKALGLLSAFSLQAIPNQKQIRAELHRLKFNQSIKIQSKFKKNCYAEGKVNIRALCIPFHSQLQNKVTIYPYLSKYKYFWTLLKTFITSQEVLHSSY